MRMARYARAPVLVVGDIDRGGVFASFVGTMEVLAPWERALVAGWVVNRFRGDAALLGPALDYTLAHTGRPVFGVVPYLEGLGLAGGGLGRVQSGALDDRSAARRGGRRRRGGPAAHLQLHRLRRPAHRRGREPAHRPGRRRTRRAGRRHPAREQERPSRSRLPAPERPGRAAPGPRARRTDGDRRHLRRVATPRPRDPRPRRNRVRRRQRPRTGPAERRDHDGLREDARARGRHARPVRMPRRRIRDSSWAHHG